MWGKLYDVGRLSFDRRQLPISHITHYTGRCTALRQGVWERPGETVSACSGTWLPQRCGYKLYGRHSHLEVSSHFLMGSTPFPRRLDGTTAPRPMSWSVHRPTGSVEMCGRRSPMIRRLALLICPLPTCAPSPLLLAPWTRS